MTALDNAKDLTPEEADGRLAILARVLDWAEAEASRLRAPDAGVCLQLARLAVDARRRLP